MWARFSSTPAQPRDVELLTIDRGGLSDSTGSHRAVGVMAGGRASPPVCELAVDHHIHQRPAPGSRAVGARAVQHGAGAVDVGSRPRWPGCVPLPSSVVAGGSNCSAFSRISWARKRQVGRVDELVGEVGLQARARPSRGADRPPQPAPGLRLVVPEGVLEPQEPGEVRDRRCPRSSPSGRPLISLVVVAPERVVGGAEPLVVEVGDQPLTNGPPTRLPATMVACSAVGVVGQAPRGPAVMSRHGRWRPAARSPGRAAG